MELARHCIRPGKACFETSAFLLSDLNPQCLANKLFAAKSYLDSLGEQTLIQTGR